jgi:hypothetical protein
LEEVLCKEVFRYGSRVDPDAFPHGNEMRRDEESGFAGRVFRALVLGKDGVDKGARTPLAFCSRYMDYVQAVQIGGLGVEVPCQYGPACVQ